MRNNPPNELSQTDYAKKSIFYISIIFVGDIFVKYLSIDIIAAMKKVPSLVDFVMASALTITFYLALSAVKEFIGRKLRKEDEQVNEALWFSIIETAFAIWLIISIISILAAVYIYRM